MTYFFYFKGSSSCSGQAGAESAPASTWPSRQGHKCSGPRLPGAKKLAQLLVVFPTQDSSLPEGSATTAQPPLGIKLHLTQTDPTFAAAMLPGAGRQSRHLPLSQFVTVGFGLKNYHSGPQLSQGFASTRLLQALDSLKFLLDSLRSLCVYMTRPV